MKSIRSCMTRALLLASGVIAAGIALAILIVPNAFFGSYGIDIGDNTSLANEMKAPAGLLLSAALLMMIGAFKVKFTVPSLATAAGVYLSYGLSRILSMATDGVPHSGLVGAAAIEVAIGTICLIDLLRRRRPLVTRRKPPRFTWNAITTEDTL